MNPKTQSPTTDDGLEWLRDIRREMAAEAGNDPRRMGATLREMEKQYQQRMVKTKKLLVPASQE